MVWAGIAGGVGQPECAGRLSGGRVGWACVEVGGAVDELQRLPSGEILKMSLEDGQRRI